MQGKFSVALLAVGFATTAVVWLLPSEAVKASAGTDGALVDADDDFLPDAVEWAVLTNAASPDTDGDTIPDFVEVVGGGNPRRENAPLPADQQMRLVISGPQPGSAVPLTWMHVFLRVLTPDNAVVGGSAGITSFDTWLEMPSLPGLRFPLNAFAAAGVEYRERVTANDGIWLQVSIPLVSEAVLRAVLPCTIYAESTIAGRALVSGAQLVQVQGDIATLVAFGDGRFVLQTIRPLPATTAGGGFTPESNRVCVLELEEVGSGPGGTVYEVVDAECEDANELECSSACPESIGWIFTIPGGSGTLGGQ